MATAKKTAHKTVLVGEAHHYERELEVFKNEGKRWGWRTRSGKNHKIVSTAGEDFSRKHDAVKAATREQRLYKPGTACVVIWED
jgi:hypothetical protein